MSTRFLPFHYALAALILAVAPPTSADHPSTSTAVVTKTPPGIAADALLDPCRAGAADETKILAAGSEKVTVHAPSVTVNPLSSAPPHPCKGFVLDLGVPSSSTPPPGYTNTFTISATIDPKTSQAECASSAVDIYRKTAEGFVNAGGGKVTASWQASAYPPACLYANASDFKRVTGSIPSGSTTDTYRVVVKGSPLPIIKLARVKK